MRAKSVDNRSLSDKNTNPRPTICVFCGASDGVRESYRASAATLGRLMGEAGIDLVFGCGRIGMMGVLADAALAAGSRVTGVIPHFLADREVAHSGVDELLLTDTMHERKQMMYERADAFAVLPGGLGTFEEMVETLTWAQLGLSGKPTILINTEQYWTPFVAFVRHAVTEGFIREEHAALVHVADTPEAALSLIRQMPASKDTGAARI